MKADGRTVLAGNDRLMKKENIAYKPCPGVGTVVYLAEEGNFLGSILISDVIKEGIPEAIRDLKKGRCCKDSDAYRRPKGNRGSSGKGNRPG